MNCYVGETVLGQKHSHKDDPGKKVCFLIYTVHVHVCYNQMYMYRLVYVHFFGHFLGSYHVNFTILNYPITGLPSFNLC